MKIFKKYFYKKKVLITGHTGFKGSWLALWLNSLGAQVCGISINTPTKPSNFTALNLKSKIKHKNLDIRNLKKLKKIFNSFQPDFVFHLAAQSLVRKSFKNPIDTFTSNAMGTCNILESLKSLKKNCSAIIITSDKSYKNLEIKRGYHENDLIGGNDPYSASKGCAELIIQSYINTFFKNKKNIKIGICRAGNVIGGGDWSEFRLIPDCIKAWSKRKTVIIRNPYSTRPWQHVLEVLSGYLTLAIQLKQKKNLNGQIFNFGPKKFQDKSVIALVKEMRMHWPLVKWKINRKKNDLESKLLKLNSNKAKQMLNWSTKLKFSETVDMTINWYKKFYNNENLLKFSLSQIKKYEEKK